MSGGRHPRIGIPWSAPSGDPEFGAVGTHVNGSSSQVTQAQTTITNVAAGDLVLVALGVAYHSANVPVVTDTSGNTYAAVATAAETADADTFRYTLYSTIAGSANASLVITATLVDTRQWVSIVSARWSGVSSATPNASFGATALISPATTNRTTTSAVSPSVKSLVIACGADYNNAANHTAANGFAKRFDGNVGSGSVLWFHERIVAASTSSGGGTNFATGQSDTYMPTLCAFTAST